MIRPTPSSSSSAPVPSATLPPAASARNSLARIRTVTRWPGGTSGGGVHGCTAAGLVVAAALTSTLQATTLLQQDDLDAQLPMDRSISD
ncbi:hypothetical protein PAHAL_6G014300 [Panicum hallii]|jgi:hypothetical protein|uniref:Uncharacterized protein n=1 Tax=Panicum hallii TaxID=206008 RepID=A0A2T8IET8_9POAL|nr:hypothetical protein PAHAL_6G014300 [Panicum hallii]